MIKKILMLIQQNHTFPRVWEFVSEQANELSRRSARANQAVRSKRTSGQSEQSSKRTSEWPSALRVNFMLFPPKEHCVPLPGFILLPSPRFLSAIDLNLWHVLFQRVNRSRGLCFDLALRSYIFLSFFSAGFLPLLGADKDEVFPLPFAGCSRVSHSLCCVFSSNR